MTDKLMELAGQVDALRKDRTCLYCEGRKTDMFDEEQPCRTCKGTGVQKENWPRIVTGIEFADPKDMLQGGHREQGMLVSVRVAGSTDEAQSTHLGIYLGDLPLGMGGKFDDKGALKLEWTNRNPAIWVPALKRIVYGMESWWGPIESAEELKAITDKDIEAIPYVKALAEMQGGEPEVKNAQAGVKRKMAS